MNDTVSFMYEKQTEYFYKDIIKHVDQGTSAYNKTFKNW